MADIDITSQLTLDTSPFMQAMTQAQQAMQQLGQGGTGITPQIDLSQWQASLNQMQQQAVQGAQAAQQSLGAIQANITLGLNLAQADAQMQAWLANIQNVNITMTVPNAVQIGTDIGNAAATAFLASAGSGIGGGGGGGGSGGGTFGAWNPATGQTVPLAYDPAAGQFFNTQNGMGMADVNWPNSGRGSGGAGSGGGGRSSRYGGGFGRLLMPLFAIHQGVRAFEVQEEYSQHMQDAAGDPEKMLEAEIHHKREQDSLVMGGGRIMRGIREWTIDPLLGNETMSQQEDQLRDLHMSERRLQHDLARAEFGKELANRYSIETAPNEQARETQEQRIANEKEVEKINQQHEGAIKDSQLWASQSRAKVFSKWGGTLHDGDTAESVRANARYSLSIGHTDAAAVLNAAANDLGGVENYEETAQTIANKTQTGQLKVQADILAAQDKRRADKVAMVNRVAQSHADAANLRASGDSIGAERVEHEADMASRQLSADEAGTGAAFRSGAPALDRIFDRHIKHEETNRQIATENVGFDAESAMRRATGQEDLASKDKEYGRKLEERIKSLENGTDAEQDLANALKRALPTMVKANQITQQGIEIYEQGASNRAIGDIRRGADEADMRASGNTRGAALSELQGSTADHVQSLRSQSYRPGTSPEEAKRLRAQADAEEEAGGRRSAALQKTFGTQDAEEIKDIQRRAEESRLDAAGRHREADDSRFNAGFDNRIRDARRAGREDVAQSIEQEKQATNAKREVSRQQQIDDLHERAKESQTKTSGNGGRADLMHIDYQAEKDLREASGDPEKQLAILENKKAQLLELKKGQKYVPSSLDDAYRQGLGRAADPAAKKLGGSIDVDLFGIGIKADQLRHAQHPNNPHPADPNHNASAAGKNPFDGLEIAAKKWNDVADKILNGPQLVTATFS